MIRHAFCYIRRLLSLVAVASSFFSASVCAVIYVPNLGHTFGEGIGYSGGYTSVGLMVAPDFLEGNSQTFLNLRGYRLSNKSYAGSIGIGQRYPISRMLIGGNVYYDYLHTHHGTFNQFGLGAEVFTPKLNIYVNGYLPVGNKSRLAKRCIFDHYFDGFVMIKKQFNCVVSGLDLELEYFVVRRQGFELSAGVGTYYLKESKFNKSTVGGQFRLLADLTRFFIEALVTSDGIYGTRVSGQLMLRIPLGSDSSAYLQPVQRRGFIATQNRCCWDTNF